MRGNRVGRVEHDTIVFDELGMTQSCLMRHEREERGIVGVL